MRGRHTLSKHVAYGYWGPDQISLRDAQGNERHESQVDFGWKLYVNNPLADYIPPEYVKNSMQLSLSQGTTEGRSLQILTARWQLFEEIGVKQIYTYLNDTNAETHSRRSEGYGEYDPQTGEASVQLKIPNYFSHGKYEINYLLMEDIALNWRGVYFTDQEKRLSLEDIAIDEAPATIDVQTTNPDDVPPVLDLNQITIQAEPTNPEAPNGETKVDISFRVKDNISGYRSTDMYLRDPNGVMHYFRHHDSDYYKVYFTRDPAVYETYYQTVILPVGSIPGTWGLAEMNVFDKAYNILLMGRQKVLKTREKATCTPCRGSFKSSVHAPWESFSCDKKREIYMLSNRLWLSCVLLYCLSVLSCGGNKISGPQPVEPDTPNEREEQVAQTAPSDTLALDFIIDGGIGNKRDDRVISGQVSGQGKKIAIEVFAIVNRPFLAAYIKFDFDSNILTYSKIENNVFFNAFIASANESILSVRDEQPKVRLPSSGFLARVEFVTKVNVTQEFTIALSQVAITYGPPEDFDIFIPTPKKVITFNKG